MNLLRAINKIVYKKLSLIIIYNTQLFFKIGAAMNAGLANPVPGSSRGMLLEQNCGITT